MSLPLLLLSHFAPCVWSTLWNSCLIQVSTSWSPDPLLMSGISPALGLSRGPVSHTKLMSLAGNDTFSRICHSKPPQTHVISPIHSQRDCLEMHHSFKSQWASHARMKSWYISYWGVKKEKDILKCWQCRTEYFFALNKDQQCISRYCLGKCNGG